MRLGYEYVTAYERGYFSLKMIASKRAIRLATVLVYQTAVSHKIIIPIEQLEPEVKQQLWEICKPYVTENTPKEERRDLARAYWVLDQLAAIKDCGTLKF